MVQSSLTSETFVEVRHTDMITPGKRWTVRDRYNNEVYLSHDDEASDTLYISFAPGEAATGIALNDQMLLRINKPERRAIGLTVFDYSVLAQPTEVPRSFPLTGLMPLSDDLRALVLDILRRPPVCQLLSLSAYTPSLLDTVPIAALQLVPVVASDT